MITVERTEDGNVRVHGAAGPEDVIDFTYAVIKWFSAIMYECGADENKICEHLVRMVANATEETKSNETD